MNGDLTERVIAVNADAWSDNELKEVIRKGEALLNVELDSWFLQGIIDDSCGAVSIVQVACRDACAAAGVLRTTPDRPTVGHRMDSLRVVRRVIDRQSARYTSFLQRFAGGFEETELDLYRWVLLPVLLGNLGELRTGLTFEHVHRTIAGYHPKEEVSAAQIAATLQTTASLQVMLGIKPLVLDYDESTRRLNIVDRGFLIWLRSKGTQQLLAELELPQYPQVGR
jgi:hypothetical protein